MKQTEKIDMLKEILAQKPVQTKYQPEIDDDVGIKENELEETQKNLVFEEPKKVSLFSFIPAFRDFIDWIVSSFKKTDDDLAVINDNIGLQIAETRKILAEIKQIPSLQLRLADQDLEIAAQKKEIADLENFVKEESDKKNILKDAVQHIIDEDLFALIEEALISSVKSLRDGGEEDFSGVKEKISDLNSKLDAAFEAAKD